MIAKTSGKIGDLIYGLPCAIAKGATAIELCNDGGWWQPEAVEERLKPLLPDWDIWCGHTADHEEQRIDLDAFRKCPRLFQQHFTLSHCEMLDVDPKQWLTKPWITVEPRKTFPTVIARGFNTRGWLDYEKACQGAVRNVGFVGTMAEYSDFCRLFPLCYARFVEAPDLLELARVIAGAELFIGNPSAPLAIAEAMHHPNIQIEMSPAIEKVFEGRNR